nr:hypothetical protein [Stenotrophomonas maltophilia]
MLDVGTAIQQSRCGIAFSGNDGREQRSAPRALVLPLDIGACIQQGIDPVEIRLFSSLGQKMGHGDATRRQ